ncbi:hypothetical protein BpHYR1_032274 [Brachionus plicatilis]|uniref:Uncharacterized protein n=1 Tax=Brachionus plicatilis TaxID=10195 RepID=A0A3M7P244_BRAPC|nr:hypothetical protein BpHYR1_032274 [Brachionus plicatilis]
MSIILDIKIFSGLFYHNIEALMCKFHSRLSWIVTLNLRALQINNSLVTIKLTRIFPLKFGYDCGNLN